MKENIVKAIQFVVFTFVMFVGFATLYGMAWIWIGLPTGWWVSVLIGVLSAATVNLYIWWVENT